MQTRPSPAGMAGVERAEMALRDIIAANKSHRTAKLTVSTDQGELKVTLVDNFALINKCREALAASKDNVSDRGKSSLQRRREKRAADPAVGQRAAAHAAERAAAEKAAAEKASAEKATAAAKEAAKAVGPGGGVVHQLGHLA